MTTGPEAPAAADPTDDAVAAALAPLANGLAADDYRLDITRTGPYAVTLAVVAGPAACADCLVPRDITRRMAEQRLTAIRRAPWEVDVRYPADA
ncbi:hypothetical protein [Yinghuangia soli]|uniref:Uncharacterized protein n=1 Tax=Yinghuangia soli TaxID=2908204 RepID=A0AA41U4J2_9ACTN|nr:hypothetical protein [Yinghuangia soli]MCF2533788.1 hypothetical protein [Yinghuangia soli]